MLSEGEPRTPLQATLCRQGPAGCPLHDIGIGGKNLIRCMAESDEPDNHAHRHRIPRTQGLPPTPPGSS